MTGFQEGSDLFQSEALKRMKDSEPSVWLAAPPELLHSAKEVSELLFSVAATYSGKSQLKKLLTDRFDAEQIWQQIDLQARPLLSNLRRRLIQLEKSGETFFISNDGQPLEVRVNEMATNENIEGKGGDGGVNGVSHEGNLSGSESEELGLVDHKSEDSSMDGIEESSEEGQMPARGKMPVEDSFLKLNEMERFLDLADAEDAGMATRSYNEEIEVSGSQEEDEEDEENVDDALNYSANMEDNHFGTETEQFRYEDFFGKDKKRNCGATLKKSLDLMPEEGDEADADVKQSDGIQARRETLLAQEPKQSAHERKLEKIRKQVEKLEKENLEQKQWTLQGEVTATKRPKNSALEVELDFEHNVRPPPVITEEVTSNLEDIIKRRICEEQFDDVEHKPRFPVPSPAAAIEIDENKSQKGLADIYEAEYMQRSGWVAPSSSDKLKAEATMLFKSLCTRLDSLSHFHFAPKPVIEDMTIRADVPAIAMEEVAPLAISDASMLAPEEVFAGKGLLKGEKELTQSERKRRRSRKKRRYKVEHQGKGLAKKVSTTDIASRKPSAPRALNKNERSGHFSYVKSAKVFAELDKVKPDAVKSLDKADKKLQPSFLKL